MFEIDLSRHSHCFTFIAQMTHRALRAFSDTLAHIVKHIISIANCMKKPPVQSSNAVGPVLSLKVINAPDAVQKAFRQVNSSQLIDVLGASNRAEFMHNAKQHRWNLEPVIISQSEFVPETLTSHLMRNKKYSALGVKYLPGDSITNMEGALHTFVTPLCPITMACDYTYRNIYPLNQADKKAGRKVILSAAVQPDFELAGKGEVVMKLVEVKKDPIIGKALSSFPLSHPHLSLPSAANSANLNTYEASLQKHMIYHLTKDHRLPGLSEVGTGVMSYETAEHMLEQKILKQDLDESDTLIGSFVRLNGHVISLEALLNIYIHQLRNEFSVLEKMLPQGYVYTMDPPAIFSAQLGGVIHVDLLNRLQILAFRHLMQKSAFTNLKIVGFNDYSDKGAIDLLKAVFADKTVMSKQSLFKNGRYAIASPHALVLHNNSDAFGQNIETEGPTSMDGVIGSYSDAACHLQRDRSDLVDFVY